MSNDKVNNLNVSFKDLQGKIEDLKQKRDDLNQKTKEYINKLQEIESEIIEALKTAKDKYKPKRDYWNKKVKALKDKKIEYKNLLENFTEEKKKIQKKEKIEDSSKRFGTVKQIERKIENYERMIETETLKMNQENDIIDKIKELEGQKKQLVDEQQNTGLFVIERKIEIVKINLNKIYEQLNKWSKKSQDYHNKIQETYQKANELKEAKKRMEEDLIENKKSADKYHNQYLESISKKSQISKKKRSSYKKKSGGGRIKKERKVFDKNQELMDKLKQDKLAVAIEKQKAGKKLNLFEARLILEQSRD